MDSLDKNDAMSASTAAPVRVLISYAHDDHEHAELVRTFWTFLRGEGIDARLDITAANRRQFWPEWMSEEIRSAAFVIVVASPAYRERAENRGDPAVGRGVRWEARQLQELLYRDAEGGFAKIVPVVLSDGRIEELPEWALPFGGTIFEIPALTSEFADGLLRLLTNQPLELDPPLGRVRRREPRPIAGVRGAAAVVVGEIPREPVGFVPRGTVDLLAKAAASGRAVVLSLTGMRGVGKTQIAAAYARDRIEDGWGLVGWVNAETAHTLLAGLAAVADGLGLADPEGDSSKSARNLRTHLQTRQEPGLLIFDNATDPDTLRSFLPATGSTQLVITSTDRSFGELGTAVDVDSFSRTESVGYLRARTGLDDDAGAAMVARELGDLPLGLAQAAATVQDQVLTWSQYLDRLRRVPVSALLQRPRGLDYRYAAAAALLLSIQAAEDGDPTGETRVLLRVLAVLSPEGVPRRILTGLPTARDERNGEVDTALGRVVAGSLLSWSVTRETVIMHRLVGRVLRDRDRADGQWTDTVRIGLELLEPLLFDNDWAYSRRREAADLVAQIEALWEADADHQIDRALVERQLRARSWAVRQLWSAADLERAIDLGRRTLADAERTLGLEHPDTFTSRGNLASALEAAGQLDQAIPLYERVLLDSERLLGSDHPNTLTARNDLASADLSVGRIALAIPLYEETLSGRERVLGPDHPDTMTSHNNLAYAYRSAGRLEQAIPIYEGTLAARERVLGSDHPDTLSSRNNLAYAYQAAGRLTAAIPLFEASLADRERVLGTDHPNTLSSKNNLAAAYQKSDRMDMSVPLFESTLGDSQRVLGRNHPSTLTAQNNLAAAYQLAGRLNQAISLFEQTVADSERILGAAHPNTMTSRKNLAGAYRQAGRLTEAIPLFERTLSDRERVLGSDHPNTMTSRADLADARAESTGARPV